MKDPFKIIKGHGQVSGLIALGFYGIGLVCLVVMLFLLLASPGVATTHPYQLESLGLAALGVVGFIASFLFGTYYAMSSLMSGSSLWSRKLASVHLFLHGAAIIWMVATFGGMPFWENAQQSFVLGGILFLLGVLAMIFTMVATASRLNLWEPAQITVISSLFWLGLAALFLLSLVLEQHYPFMSHGPWELLQIHSIMALAGFLWLGMLGISLKLFTMFMVCRKMPGVLSWIGCILLNATLMLLVPVLLASPSWAFFLISTSLLMGSLFYFADLLRILFSAHKKLQAGSVCALLGLLVGLATMAWLVAGTPSFVQDHALAPEVVQRMVMVLVLFGVALPLFLGIGTQVIPFLVWRIRCMPYVGSYQQPFLSSLFYPRSGLVAAICLLVGITYVILGQFIRELAATQLGTLTILVGVLWFLHALYPSFQAFLLGVEPVPEQSGSVPRIKERQFS